MRLSNFKVLLIALAIVGCKSQRPAAAPAPPDAAPERVAEVPVASLTPSPAPSPQTPQLTAIANWGVEVALPPTATSAYDAVNERYTVQLKPCAAPSVDELAYDGCQTLVFSREPAPAPATLGDARARWEAESHSASDPARTLAQGVIPTGGFFMVRSFGLRVGFAANGRNIHTFRRVTRVYAMLRINDASHVSCTGYWEQGAVSADDPAVLALRDVCTSMRLLR